MTIEEMKDNMTIFYRKENGAIKQILGGVHDMSCFGEEEHDFSQIWGYVVVKKDSYVMNNSQYFIYDTEAKQLKLKQDSIPQYPTI